MLLLLIISNAVIVASTITVITFAKQGSAAD